MKRVWYVDGCLNGRSTKPREHGQETACCRENPQDIDASILQGCLEHPKPEHRYGNRKVLGISQSLIRNSQLPRGHQRTLGIGLRLGPRGLRFLVSEVPLQSPRDKPAVGSQGGAASCIRDAPLLNEHKDTLALDGQ